MSQTTNTGDIQSLNQSYKEWFSDLIGQLGVDHMLLEAGVASKETKQMYDTLIFGKESEIFASGRIQSSMYFIKGLLKEYFDSLAEFKTKPRKLGLELSDAKILVWAEINDDDEEAEDALILSEAKANAKYHDYGFHISSTIVETSDKLPVPSHYTSVIA
jgi:hypothetical protein